MQKEAVTVSSVGFEAAFLRIEAIVSKLATHNNQIIMNILRGSYLLPTPPF